MWVSWGVSLSRVLIGNGIGDCEENKEGSSKMDIGVESEDGGCCERERLGSDSDVRFLGAERLGFFASCDCSLWVSGKWRKGLPGASKHKGAREG